MAGNRPNLNVRCPDSLLRKIDALIEKEEYSDRTDFITQAIIYLLERDNIRTGLKNDIIQEVAKEHERRLYSKEYIEFIGEIAFTTMNKIIEDRKKK